MVVIRLARAGSKKNPFYHIVATDKRNPRDGRHIEQLGFFNPVARGKSEALRLERAKVQAWLDNGAQMTDSVVTLVKQWDKNNQAAAAA